MKTLLMNDTEPAFCAPLAQKGYQIIPSKKIDVFLPPEQRHADLQALSICGRLFTPETCIKPVGQAYPDNVRLNCLFVNHRLYGHLGAVDPSVLEYCRQHEIRCVHVNQGYARCSTLVLNDTAAVTADKSIEKALRNDGVDVLLIRPGHIRLEGFPYGFIGGATFTDDRTVFCFGDITKHPDYLRIRQFCEAYHFKIEIIGKTAPLTDIGGAVLIGQTSIN